MSHQTFATFFRRNWMPVLGLLLSVALSIWFVASFVFNIHLLSDPRPEDLKLKAWMTPRYVVLIYDLPRPLVADLLQLGAGEDRRKPLHLITEDLGISMDELNRRVREAAKAHHGVPR